MGSSAKVRLDEADGEERRFMTAADGGEVSALLLVPEGSTHLLVLAHGASTSMRHPTLGRIARSLARAGIGTFRYNFPYMERGTRLDPVPVCTATVRAAVAAAREAAPGLPLLAGGHSFGGRMTTTAAAEAPLHGAQGLVLFSFPLHPPGRPSTDRAAHLDRVAHPMLFLSGTRDALATLGLLTSTVARLGSRATLHLLETADHGYRTLMRTRPDPEGVFEEMAGAVRGWAAALAPVSGADR